MTLSAMSYTVYAWTTMNLRGEFMQKISIIGAGLSCVDIIKSGRDTTYDFGGTAANVTCALSRLGMNASLLVPHYGDRYADSLIEEFRHQKINVVEFKRSRAATPCIIELCGLHGEHTFETVCPTCGTKLNHLILPTATDIRKLGSRLWEDANVFFFDRISEGIKVGIRKAKEAGVWTYYEPNSCRQYSAFYNNVAQVDIVKFSGVRIPSAYADQLLLDLDEAAQTKLIIVSQGEKGLKFSLKADNGRFNEWIYLKAVTIQNLIDTSGAGDWLTATFLWYFLREFAHTREMLSLNRIFKFLQDAQTVSAHSCQYTGPRGMLKSSDGIAFLNHYFNCDMLLLAGNRMEESKYICKSCLNPL